MRLINVTNSHLELVKNQLKHTDAILVEVYSAGNTDVIFSQAPTHYELLITNKHRAVKLQELDKIREFFFKRKIDPERALMEHVRTIHTERLIEISIPCR